MSESRLQSQNVVFSFHRALTNRVAGFEIWRNLWVTWAESKCEFSDFTGSENSDNEVDDFAIFDSIRKENYYSDPTYTLVSQYTFQITIVYGENMQNYDGCCEVYRKNHKSWNEALNMIDIQKIFLLFFAENFLYKILSKKQPDQLGNFCFSRSPARHGIPVWNLFGLDFVLLIEIVNKSTIKLYFSGVDLKY